MRIRVVAAAMVVVVVLAACGEGSDGSGQVRSTEAIISCLKADQLSAQAVHLPHTAGAVKRGLTGLVMSSQLATGVEIAVYKSRTAAAKAFSSQATNAAEMFEGNVILVITAGITEGTLSPPAALSGRIERCAFEHPADPKRSSFYIEAYVHDDGYAVAMASGCLACHMIGANGNDGPGPNLTDIGRQLTAVKIARILRDPVAPMPSFGGLEHSDPRAWRALITYLSHLRTG